MENISSAVTRDRSQVNVGTVLDLLPLTALGGAEVVDLLQLPAIIRAGAAKREAAALLAIGGHVRAAVIVSAASSRDGFQHHHVAVTDVLASVGLDFPSVIGVPATTGEAAALLGVGGKVEVF